MEGHEIDEETGLTIVGDYLVRVMRRVPPRKKQVSRALPGVGTGAPDFHSYAFPGSGRGYDAYVTSKELSATLAGYARGGSPLSSATFPYDVGGSGVVWMRLHDKNRDERGSRPTRADAIRLVTVADITSTSLTLVCGGISLQFTSTEPEYALYCWFEQGRAKLFVARPA
mgnify:CR=1 FL=1